MSGQGLTKEQNIPPAPSPRAAWLYKHGAEIVGLRVDYVMLTEDRSKTVWHLELADKHKETVDESELSSLLTFYPHHDVPSHRAIAILKRELQEQCRVRAESEKKNNRELAEYKRLKAKFEGSTDE